MTDTKVFKNESAQAGFDAANSFIKEINTGSHSSEVPAVNRGVDIKPIEPGQFGQAFNTESYKGYKEALTKYSQTGDEHKDAAEKNVAGHREKLVKDAGANIDKLTHHTGTGEDIANAALSAMEQKTTGRSFENATNYNRGIPKAERQAGNNLPKNEHLEALANHPDTKLAASAMKNADLRTPKYDPSLAENPAPAGRAANVRAVENGVSH